MRPTEHIAVNGKLLCKTRAAAPITITMLDYDNRSKHARVNVCMNCKRAIKAGDQ